MSDVSKKVKARRAKRKLKAAASVALAITAGLFLACQRGATEVSRIVDAARGGDGDTDGGDEGTTGHAEDASIVVRDASGDVQDGGALDASRPDAMTKHDKRIKDASVDVNEHRKGMPVRDNLLE